jgi:rhodanese-related sulfurtransferase
MNYLYFILIVLALAGVAVGMYLYRYAMDSPYRITAEEAKRRIGDGDFDVILDVRTDVERAALGYYPNSVHIQSADLEKQMPAKYPNKLIISIIFNKEATKNKKKIYYLTFTYICNN